MTSATTVPPRVWTVQIDVEPGARNLKGVVDLDLEISSRALQHRVTPRARPHVFANATVRADIIYAREDDVARSKLPAIAG
jgi:hypothetical protein